MKPGTGARDPGPGRLQRIVLASSNAGKLVELQDLLSGTGIEWILKRELGIDDPAEVGTTFVENAIIKARHAARASGLPALADDSGICVDALGGAPGLDSALYAGRHGDDAANNARLLRELDGVAEARRGAHYTCVLVLLRNADDPDPVIAIGRWTGHILAAPRGTHGFGYDPLFLPDDGNGLASAELDPAVKNRTSHRGQALARLRLELASAIGPDPGREHQGGERVAGVR